jgi:hypothetical protein
MTNDEKLAKYDTHIIIFRQAQVDLDIERICKSVEHVRSEGMLYQDFSGQNVNLLEILVTLAHDLLRTPFVYTSNLYWWFVAEVYDIIFHQVSLAKYPSFIAELYFRLTNEVLNERFYGFHRVGNAMESYKTCIYFILMTGDWFSNRPEEFVVLFDKLKPLLSDQPDDLEQTWIEKHKLLIRN